MVSRLNPSEMSESADDADQPVAAHAEIAHVVEEDHAGRRCWISRFAEQSADEHVRSARLIDHGAAKLVMPFAKNGHSVSHRAAAQIGTAIDDNPRRLADRVRVDDVNSLRHPDLDFCFLRHTTRTLYML